MKHQLLIAFLAGLLLVSCKKDKDAKLEFEGITHTDEQGTNMGFIDATDWRTDDAFTMQEMQLFDTLDFKRIDKMQWPSGKTYKSPGTIIFYPNPTTEIGRFDMNFENFIIHIEMVDNAFNKLISFRGIDKNSIAFTFQTFNPGVYRAYYVVQDLQYNIIGLGHGDIKKE